MLISSSLVPAFTLSFLAVFAFMTIVWVISVRIKNASIVDVCWGLCFVLQVWVYFALTPEGFVGRKILIGLLVTVWGLRLSIHILRRNWGKPEDYRYQAFRRHFGPQRYWWVSLFQVFWLQGGLSMIIGVPLLAAQISPTPDRFTALDVIACAVWAVGFGFEAIGDWQLVRFRSNPANQGQVLDRGLWRHTRHPNYFGDAVQWWGFYLIALAAGGWWCIFSPVIMTPLLMRVSGVSLLEKSLAQRKPGYREYMAATSSFIPWKKRNL
jgi:steroid 5-alpha reductase family enzyme